MAGKKGIAGARLLALRAEREQPRGGNAAKPDGFARSTPDALAAWCDGYLESLAIRNYSPETIEGRRDALKTFNAWAHERTLTRAAEITRPILESYQRWLWRYERAPKRSGEPGKRLGISTQRGRLGALKDWFSWLVRQNVLLSNPASELELPRMEKRLPAESLSLREVELILSVPDLRDPLGIRDRAILEMLYSCGLRRAELARLDLTDLNRDRRTLQIRQGKGRKDRVIPIGARALAWSERYLAEVRPRLCLDTRQRALFLTGYGGPFNPDVLSRMVAAFIRKAEIGRPGSCHLFRHTCATHLLEGGADIRYIQQLLGHEKLETTAIYTEVSITQLQLVHARCHPAERPSSEHAPGDERARGADAPPRHDSANQNADHDPAPPRDAHTRGAREDRAREEREDRASKNPPPG